MGFWDYLYMIGVYLAAAACIYAAVRIWVNNGSRAGIVEILVLIGFFVGYWLLESHALATMPFYNYPTRFTDTIDLFDFGITPDPIVFAHPCFQAVDKISLTVPLLETSMTYCFMWTARLLLTPHGWTNSVHSTAVAPFMVGLMALVLDGFLDPVFSQSFHCGPTTLNHIGMDIWQWHASADLANVWYGIPLFNYAAWYAAPVLLVTLVMLIYWFFDLFLHLMGRFFGEPYPRPSVLNGLFQLAVFIAFTVIYVTSLEPGPPMKQLIAIVVAILISLSIVIANASTYDRNNAFRWEFVIPPLIIFLLPLLMLLFSSTFLLWSQWHLLLLSIGCVIVGVFYVLRPYSGN